MFNSKQKKVISIGLTVSLLALSLAGCGKQKTTGNEILDDARGTQTYVQQNYTTLDENVKKQETVYINPQIVLNNLKSINFIMLLKNMGLKIL